MISCSAESSSNEWSKTEYCIITFISNEPNATYNNQLSFPKDSALWFPNISKTGYIAEWYNESKIKIDNSYIVKKDETITAKWKPITYTICFDANGGDGKIDDIVCTYNVEQKLPQNTFTPPKNYRKTNGWCNTTKISENSILYNDNEIVKNLSNKNNDIVTLYAVYSENDYTATFVDHENCFIARIPCNSGDVINNKIPEIPNNIKSKLKIGYKFADGWYDDDGEKADLSTPISNNMTFKLKVAPITYTIKFDKNSCEGDDIDNIICKYDEEITLPENKLKLQGYLMNGWNKRNGGYSYKYFDSSTHCTSPVKNLTTTDGAIVTLYSEYKTDYVTEYTITLKSEHGEFSEKTFKAKSNSTIYQSNYSYDNALPKLSENGYHFNNWKVQGESYSFYRNVTVKSDMTFVALWQPYNVQVWLDVNLPTGTKRYGSTPIIASKFDKPVSLTLTHYVVDKLPTTENGGDSGECFWTFKGWTKRLNPIDGEKYYADGEIYDFKDEIIERENQAIFFYSQWERVPVSISVRFPLKTKDTDIECEYDEKTKTIKTALDNFSGTFYLYVDENTEASLNCVADEKGKGTFNPFNIKNLTTGMHSLYITATKEGIEYSQTFIINIARK